MFLTLIIIRHFLEQQFKIISEGSCDPEDAITICFSILKYMRIFFFFFSKLQQ